MTRNINRRSFVKEAGIFSSTILIAPSCKLGNSQGVVNEKLGVALVGLGSYSRGNLAPALQLTEHCELRGIVTGSPEKIPQWQSQYGIKDENVYNYENMHELADNDDIDVVYIVVPTGLHKKYAVIAANAGKHVWCEKPMAMNVRECQEIIDACRSNQVKLCIGYRMQHEENTKRVIDYATSKPFGEIQSVKSEAGYRGGGGSGWRYQKALGGGAMYDMGVYTVNGIRYSTGMMPRRVIEARHIINRPDLFKEVDETTEYSLELENGIIAKGRTSVGESMNELRLDCERGWYNLSPMQSYSGVKGGTSNGEIWPASPKNQQATQMDDDALAIKNGSELMVPGEQGLIDIRIIEAIFESAATGKSVDI